MGDLDAVRLWEALIEIDTYLAADPQVWRILSVAKAGDVLCEVLGSETIGKINAEAEQHMMLSDRVDQLTDEVEELRDQLAKSLDDKRPGTAGRFLHRLKAQPEALSVEEA